MEIIKGSLITLAKEGKFDVIAHGCNCFCTMGAGLAPQMAKAFGTDEFFLEQEKYRGDFNKLGQIDYERRFIIDSGLVYHLPQNRSDIKEISIVNCYTQYGFGSNHTGGTKQPLDYTALTMCFKKLNHEFKGKHIGLPWIGCGLAGGDIKIVRKLIENCFSDCQITLVEYDR